MVYAVKGNKTWVKLLKSRVRYLCTSKNTKGVNGWIQRHNERR